MKTPAVRALFFLVSTGLPAWAQAPAASPAALQPPISEIAAKFKDYTKVTQSVVYVNPELAMLCRGASEKEVEAARVKFGPHANTGILIYMNDLAAEAFGKKAAVFPVGAVVVKQKTIHGYRDKSGNMVRAADTGVGGMVKRPAGYDPKHGDWEYFYFENPQKIESGRITSCVECHEGAKAGDYVFGNWSKPHR